MRARLRCPHHSGRHRTQTPRYLYHMNPDQPEPRYEGPDDFDINRPESGAPPARWIGRGAKVLVVVGGLLFLLSMFGRPLLDVFQPPAQATTPPIERTLATVTRVIDGVTISVEIEGRQATVRYLGVEQPTYGTELHRIAAEVNRTWVQGAEVLLERDVSDADIEGRLLRYVWVEDAMVNAALLEYGLARHAPNSADGRYAGAFNRIETEARAQGLGIWQAETGDAAGAGLRSGAPSAVAARRTGSR